MLRKGYFNNFYMRKIDNKTIQKIISATNNLIGILYQHFLHFHFWKMKVNIGKRLRIHNVVLQFSQWLLFKRISFNFIHWWYLEIITSMKLQKQAHSKKITKYIIDFKIKIILLKASNHIFLFLYIN